MSARESFRVRVGEREHEVEIIDNSGEGPGDRIILVDGEPFEVEPAGAHVARVSPGEAGHGRQLEVTISDGPRPSEGWIVGVRAKLEVRSAQEAQLAAALGKGAVSGGSGQLTAPMPGRVVKVLVSVGETVGRDVPAVIIEAMKMENELHTAVAGVVRSVAVAEGDTVEAGQVLCEIEVPEAAAG